MGKADQARWRDTLVRRKAPRHALACESTGTSCRAYALSPIDLIPDFIPVLGYVDDILLLPALIWLTVKLLPESVLAECRVQADAWLAEKGAKPRSRAGAIMIIVLWVATGVAAWLWLNPQSV